MKNGRIRVGTTFKTIEVNDNGDTIIVSTDSKGYARLQKAYKRLEEITKHGEDIDYVKACDELHDIIEDLYGDGACRKLYGGGTVDVSPDPMQVLSTFEQLLPFYQETVDAITKTAKTKYAEYEEKATKLAEKQAKENASKVVEFKPTEPVVVEETKQEEEKTITLTKDEYEKFMALCSKVGV